MPAHKPASSPVKTPALVAVIQKKPAWLIPIAMGVVILVLLTVLLLTPAKKQEVQTDGQVVGELAKPSEKAAMHDSDAVKYVNERYGFSLYFPKNWSEKFSVMETTEGVSVKYTASGNSIELFTIIAMTEESWRERTEKPYLLSSRKGIVFGYTTPSVEVNPFTSTESATTFLQEYRGLLSAVPKVVQSFEFVR